MSNAPPVDLETAHFIRDHCLCLHAQRAARALARRFDKALRPLGLTNGQFSLMTALSRPVPHAMGNLVTLLAMDRTTLTAALKPLERRGLVEIRTDPDDRRSRQLMLTPEGRALLAEAVPIWRDTHAAVEAALDVDPDALRAGLNALNSRI